MLSKHFRPWALHPGKFDIRAQLGCRPSKLCSQKFVSLADSVCLTTAFASEGGAVRSEGSGLGGERSKLHVLVTHLEPQTENVEHSPETLNPKP